jgi:hypothetical protein
MKNKEVMNIRPLRWLGINGIVLWPFIFYADREPSTQVRKHEAIHLAQIRRTGVARFYGTYLFEYGRGRIGGLSHDEAYRNISFEREAYENQHDPEYPV